MGLLEYFNREKLVIAIEEPLILTEMNDQVTVVVCPLRDGRNGGAIGYVIKDGDEDNFDAWYRPNDGGCGPSDQWGEWYKAGYRSKAEAYEALGIEADDD